MTSRHVEQPMPTLNDSPSIQSMVRDDLGRFGDPDPLTQLIQDDLLRREQVGVERYGTPLQAHNGRDALRDAYEEALDLACYAKQAIVEGYGDVLVPVYRNALASVRTLRWAITVRDGGGHAAV